METQIKKMKFKLTVLSVFLISLIVFLFWASFLVFKYYSSNKTSLEKVKNYEISIDNLSFSGVINLKENSSYKILFNNFFILFNEKWESIYNNSPFLNKWDLSDLINSLKHEKLYEDDGYLIHNYTLKNNYKIITLFFLSYSQEQLFYDLIKFFAFILIFSIWLYFWIYRFINYLLKPIEENFKSMKYFVQVAGHELKTPISIISSSVQLLKQTKIYDDEIINEIRSELYKSDNLINWLIDLYNINNLSSKNEIKVSELVYEVVKNLKEQIRDKKLNISVEFIEEINIFANRYYIYMLISNLLSNAIKYSKIWWKITININEYFLKVKDFWLGISKKEQVKIWDIFYRAKNHRDLEWFWLGLAIVKRIVDTYNWKIWVNSEVWIWSEFVVEF